MPFCRPGACYPAVPGPLLQFGAKTGLSGGMDLIDILLTREQFDALDPEVVAILCDATRSDLEQWSDRLLVAWQTDDEDGVHRARHALKCVCGIYGADALMALAGEPLAEESASGRLGTCVEATIAAIRAVAGVPAGLDAATEPALSK